MSVLNRPGRLIGKQYLYTVYGSYDPVAPVGAVFTGSISGTVLTVTSVASGSLAINQQIVCAGITAGTYITSLATGTGGTGTYNLSQSSSLGSQTMQSAGVVYNSLTNNNLTIDANAGGVMGSSFNGVTTFGKTSGKWYWEWNVDNIGQQGMMFGICQSGTSHWGAGTAPSGRNAYMYYQINGQKYSASVGGSPSGAGYGAAFNSVGKKVSGVFDADAGSLSFWNDGADQGVAFSSINMSAAWFPCHAGLGGGAVGTINCGATAFSYTPPVGYSAYYKLSNQNA